MAEVTVKELAEVTGTPVERLLQQMQEAGLPHKAAEQTVSDDEKQRLLAHLKSAHGEGGGEPQKITLKRKTVSKLKVPGSKTVNVEVRKKRTFVKRDAPEAVPAPEPTPAPPPVISASCRNNAALCVTSRNSREYGTVTAACKLPLPSPSPPGEA